MTFGKKRLDRRSGYRGEPTAQIQPVTASIRLVDLRSPRSCPDSGTLKDVVQSNPIASR